MDSRKRSERGGRAIAQTRKSETFPACRCSASAIGQCANATQLSTKPLDSCFYGDRRHLTQGLQRESPGMGMHPRVIPCLAAGDGPGAAGMPHGERRVPHPATPVHSRPPPASTLSDPPRRGARGFFSSCQRNSDLWSPRWSGAAADSRPTLPSEARGVCPSRQSGRREILPRPHRG